MRSAITLRRHAIRNFSSPLVSKELNRANQRKWLRAVEYLGDKWSYMNVLQLQRKEKR